MAKTVTVPTWSAEDFTTRKGRLGHTTQYFTEIESTNDRAKQWAKRGAPDGAAVVAHQQSKGRGQGKNKWASPPGAGLYVSFILRFGKRQVQASLLPLSMGLATQQSLQQLLTNADRPQERVAVQLKWPNDILVGDGTHRGKKLAGILCESFTEKDGSLVVVAGIGININAIAESPEIRRTAASLAMLTETPPTLPQCFSVLCQHLEVQIDQLLSSPATVATVWMSKAYGHGEAASFRQNNETLAGVFQGINPDGSLSFAVNGAVRTYYTGHLRFLTMPRP